MTGYKVIILDEVHLRGTDFHTLEEHLHIHVVVLGPVTDYGEMNQLHGRCTRSNKQGVVHVFADALYNM